MYRVFRSEHYERKLFKCDHSEQERIFKFEQALKQEPFSGKPLGYRFFREKKFNGKRMLFLVYEEHSSVFLVTLTDKKAQQQEIDLIKAHLEPIGQNWSAVCGDSRLPVRGLRECL